jgi:hypothetical protein
VTTVETSPPFRTDNFPVLMVTFPPLPLPKVLAESLLLSTTSTESAARTVRAPELPESKVSVITKEL